MSKAIVESDLTRRGVVDERAPRPYIPGINARSGPRTAGAGECSELELMDAGPAQPRDLVRFQRTRDDREPGDIRILRRPREKLLNPAGAAGS
jgi:hypothetical protein